MTGVGELSTTISNLRQLRESDLGPYDAVYLGNAFCRLYEGNLLERPAELGEAIGLVRARGKRPRLATYAAARNEALPVLTQALEVAAAEGAEAVEVHALGVLMLVRDRVPGLPVHVGSLAGVYTDAAVEALVPFGVARVAPSHELPLAELDRLAGAGVPLEIVVHGKIPLGVSDTCTLLEHTAAWGVRCPDLCQREVFYRKEADWALKSVGKGVLSGRDVCLLDDLPRLLAAGHRHFRIEAASESSAYRYDVAAVYREAVERALAGDTRVEARWWDTLRRHTPLGLCNGFAAGRSGMDYVPAADPSAR